RELITIGAVLTTMAIAGAIGFGTSAAIYTATNWESWNLGEFLVAGGIGAIGGAVGAGVGGAFGSLFASPLAGSLLGGAVGGAAGSSAGYGASYLGALILDKSKPEGNLLDSVWTGAALGAAFGLATYLVQHAATPRYEKGDRIDIPENKFASDAEAQRWAGERFHDQVHITGDEVGLYGHRNPDKTISIGPGTAGDNGSVDPLGNMRPGDDLTSIGHLHPTEEGAGSMANENFSQGPNKDTGYLRRVQAAENRGTYAGDKDVIESHLSTPRGNHKVQWIGKDPAGPINERTLGSLYLLRPATATAGGMGASAHRIRWPDE